MKQQFDCVTVSTALYALQHALYDDAQRETDDGFQNILHPVLKHKTNLFINHYVINDEGLHMLQALQCC